MKAPLEQSDVLHFASLVAHQLQSPLNVISTILKTLAHELAGPLTVQQKDLIARASARCDDGVARFRRLVAIVSMMSGHESTAGTTNIAAVIHSTHMRYVQEALEHHLAVSADLQSEAIYVRGPESALAEVVDALVNNACKFTPDHGRIRLAVTTNPSEKTVCISVSDSGVGIPEQAREAVFQPFFRTPAARDSTRPGLGLGLALVKAVVEQLGGSVQAGQSELGGAQITARLPMAEPEAAPEKG